MLFRSMGRYEAYTSFQKDADTIIKNLSKTADPASMQDTLKQIRANAIYIAEQDPRFAKFYKTFYQSKLGPIEELKY